MEHDTTNTPPTLTLHLNTSAPAVRSLFQALRDSDPDIYPGQWACFEADHAGTYVPHTAERPFVRSLHTFLGYSELLEDLHVGEAPRLFGFMALVVEDPKGLEAMGRRLVETCAAAHPEGKGVLLGLARQAYQEHLVWV